MESCTDSISAMSLGFTHVSVCLSSQSRREAARAAGQCGPRTMIVGPPAQVRYGVQCNQHSDTP